MANTQGTNESTEDYMVRRFEEDGRIHFVNGVALVDKKMLVELIRSDPYGERDW